MSLMEEEDASPFAAGAPPGAAPRSSVGEYSDMIIARSTIPGYVSFRNTGLGAWFIQDLTKVFMENAHNMHVQKMLGKVFEELNKRESAGGSKQVSEFTNIGFNKDLYLHPGMDIPQM